MLLLPPDFDPEALVLREATEAEKITSWRHNSEAWRGKLTVEDWIGLQSTNGNQELTRNGGIRYWVFTDNTEIYCAAETLKKPIVATAASNDEASQEWSYGIGCVFTPAPYRRRGIASTMMRRLADWLDGDEAQCRFTYLYSGVGAFYAPFGWEVIPTREVRLSVPFEAPAELQPDAALLTKEDLKPLIEQDVDAITSDIGSSTKSLGGRHCWLAYLPTHATAAWHFGAEEYVSSRLYTSPVRTPTIKGAMSSDGKAWCYWIHDYNSDRLTILRLVIPSAEHGARSVASVTQLLYAALSEAGKWSMKEVAVWHPNPQILSAARKLGVKTELRDEIQNYLPCLRLKKTDVDSNGCDGVDWTVREAYARC